MLRHDNPQFLPLYYAVDMPALAEFIAEQPDERMGVGDDASAFSQRCPQGARQAELTLVEDNGLYLWLALQLLHRLDLPAARSSWMFQCEKAIMGDLHPATFYRMR